MGNKQGASLGDPKFFDDDTDGESFKRSVNIVLEGLQVCIAHAVNRRDMASLEKIQKTCNEIFINAASCIQAGEFYKIGDD
jgi:hypothetical protein